MCLCLHFLLFLFLIPSCCGDHCFALSLENECSHVLGPHNVSFSSATQEQYFSLIAQTISDVRMFPNNCRRPFIGCLCGILFSSCDYENGDMTFVCDSICSETTPDNCDEYFNSSLIISLFQSNLNETNESKECFLPPNLSTVPVLTCLPDGVQCCHGMYKTNPDDGECDTLCVPSYNVDQRLVLSFLLLFFVWGGFFLCIIGFVPYICDPYARSFPNHLPMFLVLSSLTFNIISTIPQFSSSNHNLDPYQLDNFICNGKSNGCILQACFFGFFSLMTCLYSLWISYRIFFICISNSSIIKYLPNLTNKTSHILLVHGTTFIFSFLNFVAFLFIGYFEGNLTARTTPGYCIPSPNWPSHQFYFYWLWLLLFLVILLFLLIFIGIRFLTTNYTFFLMQFRAVLVCFLILNFLANIASLFILNSTNREMVRNQILENSICENTFAREIDPACRDYFTPVSFSYSVFLVISVGGIGFWGAIFVSLSRAETWAWWWDLITKCKFIQISHRVNPTLRRSEIKNEVPQS
jgi:hypothetical protein